MRKLRLYDTDSNVVYKFTTDQKFHGSKRIKIEGAVTIEKCLVDYPALINGKIGVVTMHQPIKTPLYTLDFIPKPFPLTLGVGTHEFEHLMFNGPTIFKVAVDKYKPKMYIGNLITKELVPELHTISPVYNYKKKDNNIWNEQDLYKLETLCKSL